MNEVEVYNAIRSEIVTNHVLLHLTTFIVVAALLTGTYVIENRKSIISVLLPILTLSWAAATVRFDYFIHRQAAYLRSAETRMQESGISIPLWETWKFSLRSTSIIVPIADVITILVILLPTTYLLFGPAQEFFILNMWRGRKVYAWGVSIAIVFFLCSLLFIPRIADW